MSGIYYRLELGHRRSLQILGKKPNYRFRHHPFPPCLMLAPSRQPLTGWLKFSKVLKKTRMSSPRNTSDRTGRPTGYRAANARGSVLPLVAFALLIIVACLGFSIDVMRNFLAVRKLQFAADAASLYGCSRATNADGSYSIASAKANMASAVLEAGGSRGGAWNFAPAGPANYKAPQNITLNRLWNTGVTFSESDVAFVSNPN